MGLEPECTEYLGVDTLNLDRSGWYPCWGQRVGELDLEKLPQLIELKYHSIRDVVNELGEVKNIRDVFVGFQRDLY